MPMSYAAENTEHPYDRKYQTSLDVERRGSKHVFRLQSSCISQHSDHGSTCHGTLSENIDGSAEVVNPTTVK